VCAGRRISFASLHTTVSPAPILPCLKRLLQNPTPPYPLQSYYSLSPRINRWMGSAMQPADPRRQASPADLQAPVADQHNRLSVCVRGSRVSAVVDHRLGVRVSASRGSEPLSSQSDCSDGSRSRQQPRRGEGEPAIVGRPPANTLEITCSRFGLGAWGCCSGFSSSTALWEVHLPRRRVCS